MELPKRVTDGLEWIIDILSKERIPYQITGGLAAHLYGSPRSINDIDIEMPEEFLPAVYEQVKDYCTFPLGRYRDERWDLSMMTLVYEGQEMDLCGCHDVRICDVRDGVWKMVKSNLSSAVSIDVGDLVLPVMAPRDLVSYKSMLMGEHQTIDIEAVSRFR